MCFIDSTRAIFGTDSAFSSIDYNGKHWMKRQKQNQKLLSTSTIIVFAITVTDIFLFFWFAFLNRSLPDERSPLDNRKSAFTEIKPTTPQKSPQKCMTSYYGLMTSPCSMMTSHIKDEPETAFARKKKPSLEGVTSVFYPVQVHPNGQCNC